MLFFSVQQHTDMSTKKKIPLSCLSISWINTERKRHQYFADLRLSLNCFLVIRSLQRFVTILFNVLWLHFCSGVFNSIFAYQYVGNHWSTMIIVLVLETFDMKTRSRTIYWGMRMVVKTIIDSRLALSEKSKFGLEQKDL